MDIYRISRQRYLTTIAWAVLGSAFIVGIAAALGKATLNLHAALTDKPDIGIYVLLEDDGVTNAELLREREDQRDYLVETASGKELVKLKLNTDGEWYIAEREQLHE